MSYRWITPKSVPHVLRPGVSAEIDHTLLDADTEAPPSPAPTAVVVQVQRDGEDVGSPITAALDSGRWVVEVPGALTDGAEPGPGWLALWTYTIDGEAWVFRRLIRLVAVETVPTVTSVELTEVHPDLVSSLRTSASDLRADLTQAWEDLDRDLWEHGVELHQIVDSRQLARLHRTLAASLRYARAGAATGDEGFVSEGGRLRNEYEDLMRRMFLYDADSDGAADSMRRGATSDAWDWVQRRHG